MQTTTPSAWATEIEKIVVTVFQTMVIMDAIPIEAVWAPEPDRLTATIHLAGPVWAGTVLLEVGRSLGHHLTSRFLGIPSPDDRDVRAVLGELANIIGGNLKCALSPGALLSMPTVVDGNSYTVHLCNAKTTEHFAFNSDGDVFWVMVVTQ